VFARKWRSRREVVDWLGSFLPVKALDSSNYRPHLFHFTTHYIVL
jgi:hypothetical protein